MKNDVNDCTWNCIKTCKDKGECPDNFIGTIVWDGEKSWKETLSFCKEKRKELKEREDIKMVEGYENIVIILESPHIEEYKDPKFRAPALGLTGCYLQNYFYEIIKLHLQKKHSYNVILMNAIQLQCSLGEEPKKFRDKLWCELWFEDGGKDNFIKRLGQYLPNIIINACTLGEHIDSEGKKKKPDLDFLESIGICKEMIKEQMENVNFESNDHIYRLKGYVQSAINDKFLKDGVKKMYISHPSSWRSKKNCKLNEYLIKKEES